MGARSGVRFSALEKGLVRSGWGLGLSKCCRQGHTQGPLGLLSLTSLSLMWAEFPKNVVPV